MDIYKQRTHRQQTLSKQSSKLLFLMLVTTGSVKIPDPYFRIILFTISNFPFDANTTVNTLLPVAVPFVFNLSWLYPLTKLLNSVLLINLPEMS